MDKFIAYDHQEGEIGEVYHADTVDTKISDLKNKIASLENELANDTKVARLITDELL